MRQSGTNKITLVQRKYLRLILQSAEGRTSYDPMVVFLELTAQI